VHAAFVALVAVGVAVPHAARADGPANTVLAATPREQGMTLYAQATKMFQDQDFIASAVTFGEAQALLARVDRDATGAVLDAEAHSFRNAALSNKATAYSRANLYVEAFDAFVELRDQFGGELSATDRKEVDDAIARMNERIGTLVLRGLPADVTEVRIDGRLERRDVRRPLRLGEGDHSLEISARRARPYLAELTIVGLQQTLQDVVLVPLTTPAHVRIESNVGASRVAIDGVAHDAPAELDVAPGRHEIVVSSESYLPQTTELDVGPSDRAVLHASLAPRRAPLGLRVEPAYTASFPLRTDTPFGAYSGAIGLAVFHDALRARNLRFGLSIEYAPRRLNAAAVGAIATWCPDRFAVGSLAWCPMTAVASYVLGESDGLFVTGLVRGRVASTFELRRGGGFARISAGLQLEDYGRDFTNSDGSVGTSYFALVSAVVEAAAGLDL